jgi:hypothetical protein
MYVTQAGLELVSASDPCASASQVNQLTWLETVFSSVPPPLCPPEKGPGEEPGHRQNQPF